MDQHAYRYAFSTLPQGQANASEKNKCVDRKKMRKKSPSSCKVVVAREAWPNAFTQTISIVR